MIDGSELLSTLNPPVSVSVSAASKEAKVTSKQSQIGKTNILGGAAGLFGGFGLLMCNPVTFTTVSTGGASSEVTWGQTFENMWQAPEGSSVGAGCWKEDSLTLSETQQQSHLHLRVGLWLAYIISSITAGDKNRPLGERYLSVYPVTAASSQRGSNRWLQSLVSLPQDL